MSSLWRDIRIGGRTVLQSPGYSLVTVITLALAIGANTLLFSLANPLVVRALPIENPERLGWILLSNPERDIERGRASVPELLEWRQRLTSFTSLAAFEYSGGTLTGLGDARRIQTARATANLPHVWGLRPLQGRLFQPGEDEPGRAMVGVLSHRYWREAFNADRAAVGRTLALDGRPITIVGVMPASIELGNLGLVDVWIPLTLDPNAAREARSLIVAGKLADQSTLASADAELQGVFANQTRDYPRENAGWRAGVKSTRIAISGNDVWTILGLLGVVVVFVLLIACANLANLVMARLVARRRESAIRLALGASRWRLVVPHLAESTLLGVIGGTAGLAIAYAGLKAINAASTDNFMRTIAIDGNVLIFTAVLSILTPVIFTVVPAMSAGRRVNGAMLQGQRAGDARSSSRARKILIGGQVALALALLVVSSLMAQSMLHLGRVNPGFDTDALLTYRFDLPPARYADDASRVGFVRDVKMRLEALPGVEHVALASHMPVLEGDSARTLSGTQRDGTTEQERPWASWFGVTDGFFSAAGIQVLAGRALTASDRADAQPVAVINRMTAERYFDSLREAIGREITIHDSLRGDRRVTIVGVAADTRDAQWTRSSPQIFVPFDQWPRASVRAIVRAADPAARAEDVQQVMRGLDAEVAVADLKTMRTLLEEELTSQRVLSGLFASYALLALLLAAGGVFGVISYTVSGRRREIGVRLALGASPAAIARMIVRESLVVTGIGAGAGLLLAMFLAQLSTTLLFGVSPYDPATFGVVAAVIIAVSVLASAAPAGRAMRIDPARTLRAE